MLVKTTDYPEIYNPNLLDPIKRKSSYTFMGHDIWNCYEISVLNIHSVPQSFVGQIIVSCDSEYIFESKSLKLYLNSLNFHKLNAVTQEQVSMLLRNLIEHDIIECLKCDAAGIQVLIYPLSTYQINVFQTDEYSSLDKYDSIYISKEVDPGLLSCEPYNDDCEEIKAYYTGSFRSNCPVTNQPDWASIFVRYIPNEKILSEKSLLEYLVSFRRHNDFHEHCIDSITKTLFDILDPQAIEVYGQFTRRGGVDINPFRYYDPKVLLGSAEKLHIIIKENLRSPRQ